MVIVADTSGVGVLESLDIVKILGLGVTGLGFLLAYFAFRLLSKEQDQKESRPWIIAGIAGFMIFSLAIIALGIYATIPHPAGPGANLKRCLEEAERRKKDYLLESVTMLIRVNARINPDGTRSLLEDARIAYTLRALKDISFDAKTFTEQYSSRFTQPNRWYGSDAEKQRTDGGYNVTFPLKEGDVITVVTGAHYSDIRLPLPVRKSFDDLVHLGANDETWTYPNGETSSGDVICTLVIVLESESMKLSPADDSAAIRMTPNSAGERVAANQLITKAAHSPAPAEPERNSISARWNNVMPGEEVGIHFTWE